MRNTFINCLVERAKIDDRLFLITPDVGFSVLEQFKNLFPDRFINVGIAEQNAIGIAAGLALSGKLVYVYSMVPFVTMRCYEQVRVDVAYMNTNVRLVGVGAGFSYGAAGATHHSFEDVAIMRALPNMTVCCPGDPIETKILTNASFSYNGPMYIRLGKNGEPQIHPGQVEFKIGDAVKVTEGKDLILITSGNMLEPGMNIVNQFKQKNKTVMLISMPTIKPLDTKLIRELLTYGVPVFTLEEHNIIGGLGSAIAEVIAESESKIRFKRIGVNDQFCHYIGDQRHLRSMMINFDELWREMNA